MKYNKTEDKMKMVKLRPVVLGWLEDITDVLGTNNEQEAIITAIREYHKSYFPEKHNYFEYAGAERRIRSDRGISKGGVGAYAERKKRAALERNVLKGDAHFCDTEGTIILKQVEGEDEVETFISYPVIDKNEIGEIEIREWRTENSLLFKRDMIFGDLEEADYLSVLPMLKEEVLKIKTK